MSASEEDGLSSLDSATSPTAEKSSSLSRAVIRSVRSPSPLGASKPLLGTEQDTTLNKDGPARQATGGPGPPGGDKLVKPVGPEASILGPGVDDDDELDMDMIMNPWYRRAIKRTVAINDSLDAHRKRMQQHDKIRQKLKAGWEKVRILYKEAAELEAAAGKLHRHAHKSRQAYVMHMSAQKKATKASKLAKAAREQMLRETERHKSMTNLIPSAMEREREGPRDQSSEGQMSTGLSVLTSCLGVGGSKGEGQQVPGIISETEDQSPLTPASSAFVADMEDAATPGSEPTDPSRIGFVARHSLLSPSIRSDGMEPSSLASRIEFSALMAESEQSGGSNSASEPNTPARQASGLATTRATPNHGYTIAHRPASRSPSPSQGRGGPKADARPHQCSPLSSPPRSRSQARRFSAAWAQPSPCPTSEQLEKESLMRMALESLEGETVPIGVQVLGKIYKNVPLNTGDVRISPILLQPEGKNAYKALSMPELPAEVWTKPTRNTQAKGATDTQQHHRLEAALELDLNLERSHIPSEDSLDRQPPPTRSFAEDWGFACELGTDPEGGQLLHEQHSHHPHQHPVHHQDTGPHQDGQQQQAQGQQLQGQGQGAHQTSTTMRSRWSASPSTLASHHSGVPSRGPSPGRAAPDLAHYLAHKQDLSSAKTRAWSTDANSRPDSDPLFLLSSNSNPTEHANPLPYRTMHVSAYACEDVVPLGDVQHDQPGGCPLHRNTPNMSLSWLAGDRIHRQRDSIFSRGRMLVSRGSHTSMSGLHDVAARSERHYPQPRVTSAPSACKPPYVHASLNSLPLKGPRTPRLSCPSIPPYPCVSAGGNRREGPHPPRDTPHACRPFSQMTKSSCQKCSVDNEGSLSPRGPVTEPGALRSSSFTQGHSRSHPMPTLFRTRILSAGNEPAE